ncbi:GGDEF and EAL domain-containing protein [Halomonas ventosae]|uniref:PAS domain S-box-containing protein/diguanylate cyclase (GGDEF)-like protein n=1 Tax=Halomonas ventosae TaxID=229007 RepID=A0A2T0VDL5_9GAMM|nr:GGDEF and EAL domain-containing protein [Halomonas ventosae]PRY68260.1 PAS domain S-box-containing protein/diguanylate cyclase (GGDEF)-like protein [Halomonas ventosae]
MQVPRAFWWGLSFLGGVLALALGGNLLLRRRVAERTRELASSEQRLASILDSVEACIFIKTPELRYAYVNQRICDLLGRPAEAILGRSDETFFDAETATRLRADDLRVFDEGRKIRQEEHNVLATSGERRVFLSTKLPLRDTTGRITSLCGISTDLTDYREILEQNPRMAFRDTLTDLPNRRLLMERLGQAIRGVHRTERFAALLLIDLDQFKLVNDLPSHLTGDRLLQRMATRLAAYTDDVNTLAHLGGDEFALLIEDLAPPLESAAQRAERVAMELLLYYQRKVDRQQRPIGLEALLRWQPPERGLVSPTDFIPLAEQSGLILPIGHWVLETACHKLVEWADIPGRSPRRCSTSPALLPLSRHAETTTWQVILIADGAADEGPRITGHANSWRGVGSKAGRPQWQGHCCGQPRLKRRLGFSVVTGLVHIVINAYVLTRFLEADHDIIADRECAGVSAPSATGTGYRATDDLSG